MTHAVKQLRFTADASHELRTPLSVIIADGELALRRDRDATRYQETIQTSVSSALHMRDVIENLIEISRLDAEGATFEEEKADLAELTEVALDLIRPIARDADVEIQQELAASPCLCSPQKIRQIVINLVGNAIHHNESLGWVKVETGTVSLGNRVFLRVSDSGKGIPQEDLANVFNRFYRTDESRTDVGRSGLGLAITRAIVEAHRGAIEVASPPGQGAIFTVTLPQAVD